MICSGASSRRSSSLPSSVSSSRRLRAGIPNPPVRTSAAAAEIPKDHSALRGGGRIVLRELRMADLRQIEAEERALVSYALICMDVYALTRSRQSYEIAHEALTRAETLRREAKRLRAETLKVGAS